MENHATDVERQEREIVERYAIELRDHASQGRRVEENGRRCYELVNECAMELAELMRLHSRKNPTGLQ